LAHRSPWPAASLHKSPALPAAPLALRTLLAPLPAAALRHAPAALRLRGRYVGLIDERSFIDYLLLSEITNNADSYHFNT
jgi:hypothetical protein